MAMTGEGNATVFIFQMKNRFHKYYKDRKAVDMTSSDGTMGVQQVFYHLPDNGYGPEANEEVIYQLPDNGRG